MVPNEHLPEDCWCERDAFQVTWHFLERRMWWVGYDPWCSVRLEWLRSKFSDISDADSPIYIMCCVRAYLLYLVGCTIFADKSDTRVSIMYLPLFENIGSVSSYTWGATALVYLYRQLGISSRMNIRQIAGFLPLLEEWLTYYLLI